MMAESMRDRERVRVEAMYAEYGERIFRFCYRLSGDRHEAEDLTQEVFVAAIRGLARFAGRASLSTWLYRIAVYRWRARQDLHHRRDVGLDEAPERALVGVDPSNGHAERLAFESSLARLPDELREALLLTKSEGLSCREAARALRIPEGTLKYRVHEAVKRLRDDLAPQEPATVEMLEARG